MFKIKKGFTLAEMMVVMLIMSIILAAMAPVMTTRSKADSSSPWRFSPNNSSDAYFGIGDAQIAMIGQSNKLEADEAARLIINSTVALPFQISFKRDNANVGHLQMLDSNIVLGNSDLNNNTGTKLTVLGSEALLSNTTGSNNTAVGVEALKSNSTGAENTAIGEASLMSNTSGTGNNALGTSSLRNNTTGSNNTAVGQDTLYNSTSGAYNNALGTKSLYNLKTGEHNVAIGYESLYNSSRGASFNTAVGNYSQLNDTLGRYNTSLGYESLRNNDGGYYNIAIGYRSNYDESNTNHNVTGSIAIGAGATAFSDYATVIGYDAGSGNTNTVTIGVNSNTSATKAVAIGNGSAASGESSVALGDTAHSTSYMSSALGYNAAATGYESTSIGAYSSAGYTTSVALGYNATAKNQDAIAIGSSVTARGKSSIAIGIRGDTNNTTASGLKSIAIGQGALARGTKNIAIGDNACSNVAGSNKICIGANSGPTSGNWVSTIDNEERIFIGSKSKFNNQPAVLEVHNTSEKIPSSTWVYGGMNGSGVVINGSLIVKGPIFSASRDNNTGSWNHTYSTEIGVFEHYGSEPNNGVGDHYLVKRLTNDSLPKTWHPLIKYSDRRLKYIGNEFTSGLDKIKELKVYNYTFKKDKSKTPHIGVIAQDLQKVFPDAVKKGADGFLTIRMEDMFYAMINAIKELDLKYQAQEKRINELEKRIERLETKIK